MKYIILLLAIVSLSGCVRDDIDHCHTYEDTYTDEYGYIVVDEITICDNY